MARNKTPEKTPLLKANGHANYNGIDNSHIAINNSNSSSIESIIDLESNDVTTSEIANDSLNNLLLDSNSISTIVNLENDWIDSVDRYGGKTLKRRDSRGNWEYITEIKDSFDNLKAKINENFIEINNTRYWSKTLHFANRKVILELSKIDTNKQINQTYKIYKNDQEYNNDLQSLDLKTFTKLSKKLSWSETLATWSNNILHDGKKIIQGVGYLGIVIGIRTIQRAFTVIVSDEGEMDWNKMVNTINPAENPIEFGLTLPQLLISVLAMDTWKWGLTNVINEINKFRAVDDSQSNTNNITSDINNNPSYFKSMIKILGTKLGYWVPNHLMITCSSMYTVKSLTSVWSYLDKLKSGWNILSTFIRAEVLWFISGFLKDGLAKFSKTYLYTNMKNKVVNLFTKEHNLHTNNSNNENSRVCKSLISLLKIVGCSTAMISATVVDNANKTAVVMWTADKLEEFVPTFITWEMALIMVGLISVDTFGNKYCNVKAKQELAKLWNDLKSNCFANDTNSQIITATDEEEFHDALDNEIELLEQQATIETQNNNLSNLCKKYNLSEEFHDAVDSQPWLHTNEINTSEPSTSTEIYHLSLNA